MVWQWGMALGLCALLGSAALAEDVPPLPSVGFGPLAELTPPVVTPISATSEASAILVLDTGEAYSRSAWGQRATAEIEAAAREIEAENGRLENQLTAEEAALTAERKTLAASAFRKKAEAFDTRAQDIRRARAQVARDLASRAQADRSAFLDRAAPLIARLMNEHGAAVVLDRRQVMVAARGADITEELVALFDTEVGPGEGLPEAEAEDNAAAPAEAAPTGE